MTASCKKILILDDDETFATALADHLDLNGFDVSCASTIGEAKKALDHSQPAVAFMDQQLPDGDGVRFACEILKRGIDTKIVLITAFAGITRAVEAIRAGAFDYLQKPVDLREIELTIERALRTIELEDTEKLSAYFAAQSAAKVEFIGSSPKAEQVRIQMQTLAEAYPSPVLLTGETGTGKGLVAHEIHRSSAAAAERFVAVNCAAIPETMFEAELFGHERGAFTGAHQMRKGLFELAGGGTLLLDEIGEVPLTMQAKLLRVLDDGLVRRIGGQIERPVRVRVLASTNRDLADMVARGTFREDLFYRLAVLRLELPPLRDRLSDIPDLVAHLIKARGGHTEPLLRDSILRKLQSYRWPGNVRELKNVVERALVLANSGDEQLEGLDLFFPLKERTSPPAEDRLLSLMEVERQHIKCILQAVSGNRTAAAKILGISRSTLKRRIRELEAEGHQVAKSNGRSTEITTGARHG